MHLSPDDIAAAEACGVSFLPASAAQVQRLAMQRKVFYQAGSPILATRGDGFFETVGTLQQLIEEGRAQQRDLAQWLQAEATAAAGEVDVLAVVPDLLEIAPAPAPAPGAEPEPARVAEPKPVRRVAPAEAGSAAPDTVPDATEAAAPKRPRQKRRRPAVIPEADPVAEMADAAPAAVPEAEPEPALAGQPDADEARPDTRLAARVDETAQSAEERGKRWLMAGAARRGRAGKHWSTRQR